MNDNSMVGNAVFTRDGEQIGEVGEVDPNYLKVEVSLQPDYWLRVDEIAAVTATGVHMQFDKADLPKHVRDEAP